MKKPILLLLAASSLSMLASCGQTGPSEGQLIANKIASIAGLACNGVAGTPLNQGLDGVNKIKSSNYTYVYKKFSTSWETGVKTAMIDWSYSNPAVMKETLNDSGQQRYKAVINTFPAAGEPDVDIIYTATVKYEDASGFVYSATAVYKVTFVAKAA